MPKINKESDKIWKRDTSKRLPEDFLYVPYAHQSSHEAGGRDELDLTGMLGGGEVFVTSVTANYTALTTDNVIECDGTFTVRLLAVALLDIGKVYNIKNVGTGTITVDGTETIEGELTQELYEGDNMTIYTNGEEWWII